jgi:hypothetical protein
LSGADHPHHIVNPIPFIGGFFSTNDAKKGPKGIQNRDFDPGRPGGIPGIDEIIRIK